MLHSLNAIRVIAEFLVVHCHVAGVMHAENVVRGYCVDDLMSLFFVLSGFVAMHSNPTGEAWGFWRRRMGKTYPTFLICLLADLPGAFVSQFRCPGFEFLAVSQALLVSPWLGGCHMVEVNGVSWYLGTLFWLWLAFPVIHGGVSMACRRWGPWASILGAYTLSLAGFACATPLYAQHSRGLPILRTGEFVMGAMARLALDDEGGTNPMAHGGFILLLAALLGASWTIEGLAGTTAQPSAVGCTLWPTHAWHVHVHTFLSKSALLWAALLPWMARLEIQCPDSRLVQFLSGGVFRLLSSFSLQLYLGHLVVAWTLIQIPRLWGDHSFWSMDLLMLGTYAGCYGYTCLVQPALDRWFVLDVATLPYPSALAPAPSSCTAAA
jgi:peptidoglycan/LPS O-acetylase OafA/YrhL